jgi:hypothetical protein
MTFLDPDNGLNHRIASPDFAVQLAKNAPQTPVKEGERTSLTEGTVEVRGDQKAYRTSTGLIAAIAARDLRPVMPQSHEEDLPVLVDDQPTEVEETIATEPYDEFTASYHKYINDPDGQIRHILRIKIAEMIEEAKAHVQRDPMELANLATHDPGLHEDEIRFLRDFAQHLRKVIKIPKHRKSPPMTSEKPVDKNEDPNTKQNRSDLRVEVKGFLSPTAKGILDKINDAISEGKTSIHGDPFATHIERNFRDSGYITHQDRKLLLDALAKYEIEKARQ